MKISAVHRTTRGLTIERLSLFSLVRTRREHLTKRYGISGSMKVESIPIKCGSFTRLLRTSTTTGLYAVASMTHLETGQSRQSLMHFSPWVTTRKKFSRSEEHTSELQS